MSERREPIPKKMRFEVFKRDSFTCQYCGRMAPDVILEVDHIKPVSKGGKTELLNLVTSCKDCNRGKGPRSLDDNSAIRKQQQQLKDLSDKNEQLEMMLKWRDSIKDFKEKEVDAFVKAFNEYCGCGLNDNGKKNVRKMLKNYSIIELLDALDESVSEYYNGSSDSANEVFNKVSVIAHYKRNPMTDSQKQIFYLRKILINRISYINKQAAYVLIKKALESGTTFEEVKDICVSCRNWSDFKNMISEVNRNEVGIQNS